MAKGFVLSGEVLRDITDIRAFYLREAGPKVARYVLAERTRAFRLLAATPGIGHARSDLTDEPVKFWTMFSYLIVNDPATEPLGIARVLHASRDLEAMFRDRPRRS